MTPNFPDPLQLWMHANGACEDTNYGESTSASLMAIWRNQEQLLEAVCSVFGHASLANLVAELFFEPLRRQMQLLMLAPVPNPQRAEELSLALQEWVQSQAAIALHAASELQTVSEKNSELSVLNQWVEVFAAHQCQFLASPIGQQQFSQLCRAWSGLGVMPSILHSSQQNQQGPSLKSLGGEGNPLVIIASPLCPLFPFRSISGGLLEQLQQGAHVHIFDWGSLTQITSVESLLDRTYRALNGLLPLQCKVLDLSGGLLGPTTVGASSVVCGPSALSVRRLLVVAEYLTSQELELHADFLPAELSVVLCDALYPDWPLSEWLAEQSCNRSVLKTRKLWLENFPNMSVLLAIELLKHYGQQCDLFSQHTDEKKHRPLLHLLSGMGVETVRTELAVSHI